MSKRSERRAAERAAHKAARAQSLVATAQPQPVEALITEPEKAQSAAVGAAAIAIPATYASRPVAAPETQPEIPSTIEFQSAPIAESDPTPIHAEKLNPVRTQKPVQAQPPAQSEYKVPFDQPHWVDRFFFLSWEKPEHYHRLVQSTYIEHKPQTDTECRLVNAMIQSQFFIQRAIALQDRVILNSADDPTAVDPQKLALFVRYQAAHERSYYRALRELQNLQKQKRKDEIGFDSQKRAKALEESRIRLNNARALTTEIDNECRQAMEIPIPGNERLSFEDLTKACSNAIAIATYEKQQKSVNVGAKSADRNR